MPYGRSRRFNNRGYKRNYRSKGPNRFKIYSKAGSQLWKDVMFLKSIVNAEKKYFDAALTANVSSTATMSWISNLTQGSGGNNRLGNSVKAHSIQGRLTYQCNATATVDDVRTIVFYSKERENSIPLVTDLLADSTNAMSSPINMSNSSRFVILYDKVAHVEVGGTQSVNLKFFIPLKHHIKWDTTGAATIGSTEEGHIFLMQVGRQATNTAGNSSYFRLRFYDN